MSNRSLYLGGNRNNFWKLPYGYRSSPLVLRMLWRCGFSVLEMKYAELGPKVLGNEVAFKEDNCSPAPEPSPPARDGDFQSARL